MESQPEFNRFEPLAQIRIRVLEAAHLAQEGHVPSALSVIEPIYAVYENWDLKPGGLDSFVLSKGHGCLALYAVMEKFGHLSSAELESFCEFHSKLGGHPDSTKVSGITASTGSLGHGYPIAAGIAYAKKHFKGTGRVFALIGDGECNEGSIWESAQLVRHHNLKNLLTWIDFNHSGDRAIDPGDLFSKWQSFGFTTVEVDGHNLSEIKSVLDLQTKTPLAVIAHSIKGKGVSAMEGNPAWHHTRIDQEFLQQAILGLS